MARPPDGPERGVELRADVVAEAARLWARDRRPPTLVQVAGRLGYSEGGLARALRRHGFAWSALRHEAWRHSRPFEVVSIAR